MIARHFLLITLPALLALAACRPESAPAPTTPPAAAPAATYAPTAAPAPAVTAEPTPEATPAPTPAAPRMSDKLTTDGISMNKGKPGVARLTWSTDSEQNSFGFYIMRAASKDGPFTPVNPKQPLLAAGNSSTKKNYTYYDTTVRVGDVYYYYIRLVNLDGSKTDHTEWTSRVMINRLNLDEATTQTLAN